MLRKLGGDLSAHVLQHHLHHLGRENVLAEVVDEQLLDLFDRLVDRDRADRFAAVMVAVARVRLDAPVAAAEGADTRYHDRAAALTAPDSTQCVLGTMRLRAARPWPAGRETLLHREPRCIVDNAPLRQLDRDQLVRLRLDADRSATLPELLDAAVDVHAAVARVEEDGANRSGSPRPAAAPTSGGGGNAFLVELVRDRLDSAVRKILGKDPAHDRSLLLVDLRDRVLPSDRIRLPFERVAVAAATSDLAVADARTQCFARARANCLELHLVAGALDECRGLVDRVCELNLLTSDVIEEPASAITDEIADHERHFEGVATEARLITAHDDVTSLRIGEQLAKSHTREKVVTRAPIIDVVAARLVAKVHPLNQLGATVGLDIEAELLLALVVLRAAAVRAYGHCSHPSPSSRSFSASQIERVAALTCGHRAGVL